MTSVPLLLLILALSSVHNLPLSVTPVRQIFYLAPELPKYQLQPTFKIQPQGSFQSIPVVQKSDTPASKQYVLVYPNYQYFSVRDDATSTGSGQSFWENFQSLFVNVNNGDSNADESSGASTAAAAATDSQSQQAAVFATKTATELNQQLEAKPLQEKTTTTTTTSEVVADSKEKIIYSYITPASTFPLNENRRVFYLSDPPQPIFGSFNGPAFNPVFNLQPVPAVLSSRSNVAQPSDESQTGIKVVSENVQKFSQIPPVMTAVVQSSEPAAQLKSRISEQLEAAARDPLAGENRVAPVVADNRATLDVTDAGIIKSDDVVEARSEALPLVVAASATNVESVGGVVKNDVSEAVSAPVEVPIVAKDALSIPAVVDNSANEKIDTVVQAV